MIRRRIFERAWALALMASMGCAATRKPPTKPIPVTVVVHGSGTSAERVKAALRPSADLPVDFRIVAPPVAGPVDPPDASTQTRLARARAAYVDAEFGACAEALAGIEAPGLLEDRRRTVAARVVFWRVACQVGDGVLDDARRNAERFAVWGLEIPADVEAATPEVEQILGAAIEGVAARPRHPVEVRANADRARVGVDGAKPGCPLPCTLRLVSGEHVLTVVADGFRPTSRQVLVRPPQVEVEVELPTASPKLAARQWVARYGTSETIDSSGSVQLLTRAVRGRRIAVINVEPGAETRIRGALALNHSVVARAERTSTTKKLGARTESLMRELLVEGKLIVPPPPLYKRAWFWVTIILTAGAAATITGVALRDRPSRTEVSF